MKLTTKKLKQIIKEELNNILLKEMTEEDAIQLAKKVAMTDAYSNGQPDLLSNEMELDMDDLAMRLEFIGGTKEGDLSLQNMGISGVAKFLRLALSPQGGMYGEPDRHGGSRNRGYYE